MGRPIPYRDLLDAALHSYGFHWPQPDSHLWLHAQPSLDGRFALLLRGGDDPDRLWDGTGWTNFPSNPDAAFRWTLAEVVQHKHAAEKTIAEVTEANRKWRAGHVDSGVVETFAEFAGVAS